MILRTVIGLKSLWKYLSKLKYRKNCVTKGDRYGETKKEGKKNIRKDISMDPEQHERLMDYCRQQDRPISWVIRQALDEYLPA